MTGYDHFPIHPNEFSEPAATRHPPLEVPGRSGSSGVPVALTTCAEVGIRMVRGLDG